MPTSCDEAAARPTAPADDPVLRPAAIRVEDLSKVYRVYRRPMDRLREAMPWNHEPRHRAVQALRGVNLDVTPGQCVGLIGGNGAGKSTLLKILTGTTTPTTGSYTIRGSVAALLELGAGFQQRATGRANIFMNAALLGRSREETRAKYEEILEFSELHSFIDQPVATYSSGMVARLGFSVAVATDPDILIIDEILAVGDMHFRRKCVDKIMSFKEAGKTMFFCSHSLYDVRQICDKTIWLRQGEVQMFDDSVTVTNEYATYENQIIEQQAENAVRLEISEAQPVDRIDPNRYARIVDAVLVDPETGKPRHKFTTGERVAVRVHVKAGSQYEPMALAVGFMRADGQLCFVPTTEMDRVSLDFREGIVTLVLPQVPLLSGEFLVPVWLLDAAGVHRFHETSARQSLIVQNRTRELGMYFVDREWHIEVLEPPPEGEQA